jgi:hypothetical protein
VRPDIGADIDPDSLAYGTDGQVNKALELLPISYASRGMDEHGGLPADEETRSHVGEPGNRQGVS